MPIRVAIVEDIETIRNGLQLILDGSEECTCVGTFSQAMEALDGLPALKPDVVLMDINMPGMKGTEAVHRLKPVMPETQFMMCTVYEDEDHIFESLKAGATGYIIKNTPPDQLLAGIDEIHRGGSPMSGSIARKVITSFQPVKSPADDFNLSEREWDVVNALAKGMRYKEIADIHHVSIDTVRSHIRNIYRKLEVQSRTEALNVVFNKK